MDCDCSIQEVGGNMKGIRIVAGSIHAIIMTGTCASAADLPLKSPLAHVYDWTGLYVGGHLGYGRGKVASDFGVQGFASSRDSFGALYGGAQIGYNYLLPSRVLLGAEADLSFPNYLNTDDVVWSGAGIRGGITEKIDYIGTVRGRLGYASGQWLVYATGGLAWSSRHFFAVDAASGAEQSLSRLRTGWAAGGGVEFAFDARWNARLEYLYSQLGSANVVFPSGEQYGSRFDMHMVRLGLNYKLTGSTDTFTPKLDVPLQGSSDVWEIHGQTTYVRQGYPNFHAMYSGPNSLPTSAQTKSTWTASAFIGVRPWDGGEIYYNAELLQGFGLSSTVGAGGFPNGEAQKSDFLYPHYNSSRLFLRQTFGLGGEQETAESNYGQMAGKKDIARVTIQAGKFAVHDVFDANAYAQDPRTDFLNWSIWAAGAFDYPADKVGLTYGAVAELNQKQWALRAGYFLIGNEPNSNNFDMALFKRGGYVTELETRYALFGRPGKLRITGWLHESFSGSYRDAVNLVLGNPGLDPTNAITSTRQGRTKYGYILNLEQSVADDIGVFARWSRNSGTNEISAFTDIDSSLSFGASISGAAWGRSSDRIGVAGAINGLSKDHRDYIAVGGLGILVGDGALNYREEKILEVYYAYSLNKWSTLTFDYQFLTDPAYNADRGPISVFSVRAHAEF